MDGFAVLVRVRVMTPVPDPPLFPAPSLPGPALRVAELADPLTLERRVMLQRKARGRADRSDGLGREDVMREKTKSEK